MKVGLRKQFAKVLALPNIHYFGHVKVGNGYDVTLDELQAMKPSAMLFTLGAQGYNRLGLPGEDSKGVYSAKDFVYYYNHLPPYPGQDFSTGKRIAIIGMGNVAVDIMRWLLQDSPTRQTEEVVVVARRGPFEAKFDAKEIEYVQAHLNRQDFAAELERVRSQCESCRQDVSLEKLAAATFPFLKKVPAGPAVPPKLTFRFLSSPTEIIAGPDGRIQKLVIAENDLVLKSDGSTAAKANGRTSVIEVDTMIFAIGDKHDPNVGLPMGPQGYATPTDPDNPKAPVFEVCDPTSGHLLTGLYVAGWARRASEGLVGIARHDGELAAAKVIAFLQSIPQTNTLPSSQVEAILCEKGIRVINKEDLEYLGRAEAEEAQNRGVIYFKYSDDDAMLSAIAEQRLKDVAETLAA
jgi:ferredoxin--NADP+ reductase